MIWVVVTAGNIEPVMILKTVFFPDILLSRLLPVCVATAWCMKGLCPSFKSSGIATIFTPKV